MEYSMVKTEGEIKLPRSGLVHLFDIKDFIWFVIQIHAIAILQISGSIDPKALPDTTTSWARLIIIFMWTQSIAGAIPPGF